MTDLAVGFGRGFPRIWLLPIGLLTVLLGIAAVGRLSRSIVADLLAWWPVWLGLALAAYFLRERKVGAIRVSGIVPLVAFVFVVLFVWGHLAGWSLMPSASQRLVGPEVGGVTEASLRAEIDGAIEISRTSPYLYWVEPLMRGGGIGIPGASEQVVDSAVSVELEPPTDPGLYTYAGWDLMLAESVLWSLNLEGIIDADLSPLRIGALNVAGSGAVHLGQPVGETAVNVDGPFRLVLPPDVPARVNGQASVPASWTTDAQGAVSPVLGSGWVITVSPGATVTVSQE